MMLVDQNAVETYLVRQLHQPDQHLVSFAHLHRVSETNWRSDPARGKAFPEIRRKVRIGNFCEPVKPHVDSPFDLFQLTAAGPGARVSSRLLTSRTRARAGFSFSKRR